jgi:hypothetical protein
MVQRQFLGGAILAAFGAIAVTQAQQLGIGTLSEMGPGFMPLVYGVVLCVLAVVIAVRPDQHNADAHDTNAHDTGPQATVAHGAGDDAKLDLRSAGCILGGAIAFIVLGRYAGMAPAAFTSVLIAALGSRTTRPAAAFALAAGITVFGCVLFGMVLHIPIPIIRGVYF